MPRKSIERLLDQPFETLTIQEQLRLCAAMMQAQGYRKPLDRVFKRERPRCGARCRDGHPCQARATFDADRCYVRNGRCRLHGGLSTGPRTPEGRRRSGEAARQRAQRKPPSGSSS